MLYRSLAASTAAIGLLLSQAAHAASGDCWSAEEARAAEVQNLNVMLMIEALKCGKTIPAVKANYEAFADRNRDEIVRSKHVVEDYFVDRDGVEGGRAGYLAYETALANELSSPAANYARCADMASFTRMAGSAASEDLPALAHMLAASRLIEACPAPMRPMAIEVWKRDGEADDAPPPVALAAAPPELADAADTTEIVDGVPTDIGPAAPVSRVAVAEPAARVEPAVASVPVDTAAADPATALQAAAHALALAADALKNASPRAPATAVN